MNKIFLQIAVYIGLSVIVIGGYHLKQKYDLQNDTEVKRALITKDLKDPSSALFRNEILKKSDWLCGEINSKNSYGAYTGFKRFLVFDSSDIYLEDIGSVGPSKNRFYTDSMRSFELEQIQREIDILKYRSVNNTAPPFKSLKEEDRIRELFEEIWKSTCN